MTRLQRAGQGPGTSGRIIQFSCRPGRASGSSAPGNEHSSIDQQGRRVLTSSVVQRAGQGPGPCSRIIEFGGGNGRTREPESPGNKHLSIGQQGCRMQTTSVM